MNELKTLKDIPGIKVNRLMLKQEAIKWVKQCSCCKIYGIEKIYDNDNRFWLRLVSEKQKREFCFACWRFKHFFNITEKELENA